MKIILLTWILVYLVLSEAEVMILFCCKMVLLIAEEADKTKNFAQNYAQIAPLLSR